MLGRLMAMVRKEFWHITRETRALFLVTIMPAFLLLMLAYVFSFDAERVNVIVLDQDKTDLSRQYISNLSSDGTFRVVAYVDRQAEIDRWLQSGRAQLALVIPPGVAGALQAGRPAAIQAILDGVDVIAAAQTLTQLAARTQLFSLSLLPDIKGVLPGRLDVRSRVWYNPSLKSLPSMVPGLVALVLYMPALALSLSLTREKEMGSFEGLSATPVRAAEYLFGKMLAYMGFGLLSTIPVLMVALLWFRVPFRGDLVTLLGATVCYFWASFGLSLAIASLVKNQQTAMFIMLLVLFVPSFFLAGLILPVDTSSVWSSLAAYSLPITHFIFICRAVFLKGMGIAALLGPVLILVCIGCLLLAVSLAAFNKWID